MGNLTVSSIGQADDTLLMSNDIVNLSYLFKLNDDFCSTYLVENCAEKTKLQVFSTIDMAVEVTCAEAVNPVKVNGQPIPFSSLAEHVGILRSVTGNGPTILARMSAHRKALAAVLHQGSARSHRGNPSSSLKLEKIYALPVLLSGLAALDLSAKDLDTIDHYYKECLRNLLKLYEKTPRSVIYFLAGTLPGAALVHLRQFSLFGMICRMNESNILWQHAKNVLFSLTITKKSWFDQIRKLCLVYNLPHPMDLFISHLDQVQFKKLIKSKVVTYWKTY